MSKRESISISLSIKSTTVPRLATDNSDEDDSPVRHKSFVTTFNKKQKF